MSQSDAERVRRVRLSHEALAEAISSAIRAIDLFSDFTSDQVQLLTPPDDDDSEAAAQQQMNLENLQPMLRRADDYLRTAVLWMEETQREVKYQRIWLGESPV